MKIFTKITFLSLVFVCSSFAQQVTGLKGWNIYLDPGHSLTENPGIYGYSEAEKNLRVALALREMLLTQTDIDTVYICRTSDQQSVGLADRSDQANRLGAAWYHSIHSDASSSPTPNTTLLLWGQYKSGLEKVPNGGKAMSDIMIGNLTRGMRTTTIQGSIGDCKFYGCDDNGPYLSVNRNSSMPSELSEAGFHTNPMQNQRNMNAEYKKLEAQTLFWSILQYKNAPRPKVGICTGVITDAETKIPVNGATITINGKSYTTDTYESLFHKYSTDPNQLHNGFYYIEGLPNTSLQVTVEAPGYQGFTGNVTVVDSFFTFYDISIAPKGIPVVSNSSVTLQDSVYPGKDNVIIDFSRTMDKPSVENSISISPNAKLSFEWSNGDKRLSIKTDSLNFLTSYKLTIAGTAKDVYNNFLDGNLDGTSGDAYTQTFNTKPKDVYAPYIVSIYPKSNSDKVELIIAVNVMFSEPLNTSTIGGKIKVIRVKDQSTLAGVTKYYTANDKSVINFFPGSQLMPNEEYNIVISKGLEDQFHNAVSSDQSFSFFTGNQVYNVTKIEDFDSGVNNWSDPLQNSSTVGIVNSLTSKAASSSVFNPITKGSGSMKFNYGFDTKQSSWLVNEYLASGTPKAVTFDNSSILQAYIYGDASGNKFRFCVDDKSGFAGHEVSHWYNIDWLGWKLISWDMMNDSLGTWDSAGDGKLDGTLRMNSFQITYTPGAPSSGTLYFDDLRLAKKTTVDVRKENNLVPENFLLEQNYPNPFNPSTTIGYQLPKSSFVTLKIYDLLGKEKATVVNTYQQAGYYKVSFNAYDLSSGIYFYKISVDSYTSIKKMILMK